MDEKYLEYDVYLNINIYIKTVSLLKFQKLVIIQTLG